MCIRDRFPPEGSLLFADDDETGELAAVACSILMKLLWLARLSRPDILKPVCELASKITKWTRNSDKELFRLICYVNTTSEYHLVGTIADKVSDLSLRLYVDADFGGDRKDARSTSGGFLCLVGPSTSYPLMWLSKRQTSTSRSTTESEVVAFAASLFSEGLPALIFWELVLGRTVGLEVMEDNQATIRVVLKGFSNKLRHISRTHKVDLSSIHEEISKDNVKVSYCETDRQAADIFTKALAPLKWDNALSLLGIRVRGAGGVNGK